VRLFYAAYLSPENMRAYRDLVDRLILDVPGALRQVPQGTHHLTLAFLGEIGESHLEACVTALDAAERIDAFSISLGRPSILKGRGRPRLIRSDIGQGREKVSYVQATLIAHLTKVLPQLDLRTKPPHVTLARFSKFARSHQAHQVDDALARHYLAEEIGNESLSEVHLVKSTLSPSGPIYETLQEAHLKEAS
jgi:2'-5' RNA ligase